MGYENFVPLVWNEAINRELERLLVGAEDCNRQYEGDIKERGQTVKILGIGKPTITTINSSSKNSDINAAEEIEDASSFLKVDQISYYHYTIGDIDRQFAIGGLEGALNEETSQGLANAMDQHIFSMASDAVAVKLPSTAVKIVSTPATDAGYVLTVIDNAQQKLWENDVPKNTPLTLTVTPRFYMILKRAYILTDTDNSDILQHGGVGKYGDITVKVSNNVATANSGATDLCMLRTKRAVAFVNPLTHTEAYRPEKKFADALKGFVLYQAKVVRPKELVVLNVKYA